MATVQGPVQPYYRDAEATVDEQAILDKYNAATIAQYNVQREQNRQNENKFYNQMYNTQRTAMDTIRQSNAAAVATGASRGVQAANELSAILGLQQESVESATELAQANRQTAQEETAAVLENVLAAYQQAQQERSQLISQGIEAASLGAQQSQADTAKLEYLRNLHESNPQQYYIEKAAYDNATNFIGMSEQAYTANISNANIAVNELLHGTARTPAIDYALTNNEDTIIKKTTQNSENIKNLYAAYGLSTDGVDAMLKKAAQEAYAYVQEYNTIFNDNRKEYQELIAAKINADFNARYTEKYKAAKTK